MKPNYAVLLTTVLALFEAVCRSQDRFPESKIARIGLTGSWESAPNVVVGDVTNIAPFGSQKVADIPNSPWPVSPEIQEIYWCQADFHAVSVVKGGLPTSGKKFLWAAIRPGCGFEWFRYGYEETSAPVTRIWFVREEGEFIRPVVDGGGIFFVSFYGKWFEPPKDEAPKTFALLMLNPAALGMSPSHYATIFHYPVGLALAILGRTEFIDRLKALAATPDPTLRATVCD